MNVKIFISSILIIGTMTASVLASGAGPDVAATETIIPAGSNCSVVTELHGNRICLKLDGKAMNQCLVISYTAGHVSNQERFDVDRATCKTKTRPGKKVSYADESFQ